MKDQVAKLAAEESNQIQAFGRVEGCCGLLAQDFVLQESQPLADNTIEEASCRDQKAHRFEVS